MNDYDDEYQLIDDLFWEASPAKFVKLFAEHEYVDIQEISVFDVGAGEGKNALYLAEKGATVDALEVSAKALSNLRRQKSFKLYSDKINVINQDALIFENDKKYDLVIAYGFLHALKTRSNVSVAIDKLKAYVKENGYIIIATFNNLLPPPAVQPYLKMEAFLNPGELKDIFTDWDILHFEEEIITESHHTSKIEHQHSISRLIARKNVPKY